MKRAVRLGVASVGLAIVVIAMTLSSGGASLLPGPTITPLARGTNTTDGTIPLQAGTDVAMVQITISPGGASGWHSHPGGAIVILQQGSLTVYASVGSKCETKTYTAGQTFIERPGELDQVINTGTVPFVLFVVFPRVPQGSPVRTDLPDPGTCPGI